MATVLFLLAPLLLVDSVHSSSENHSAVDKILEDRLGSASYNSRVRPGADSGEPLIVYVNVNVNDISYISEAQQEYSMTLYLRQLWIDERLAYDDTDFNRNITLNYNQFERIWTPDLFIRNLKSGTLHTITVPNRLIRLSPDGRVFFSQRLAVTLSCDMHLDRFPMDNQTCKFEIGSYAYSIEDLIFKWRVDAPAVEMIRASLPEYTVTGVSNIDCTQFSEGKELKEHKASFPCLRAYFHLTRRLKAYILNTYVPSFLVVLLSWLSFWIDPESAPARTSLSILTILTITTQSSGLMRSLPSGSITKAIDVWMATCLVFVFGAFIEYSAVNTLARRRKEKRTKDRSSKANGDKDVDGLVDQKNWCGRRGGFWSLFDYKDDPAMTLERLSRIFFPLIFFIFCLFYWPIYLIQ